MTLLKLENISVVIDNKTLLDNISFEVRKGQILTIIGPNGSGKTTLARAILGLINITSGKIIKDKTLRVGYMPQKLHINSLMPITAQSFLELSSKELKQENFKKIVKTLALEKILQSSIHTLSGGEMQRVMLAKALIHKPNLLILDEPIQGVDVTGQAEFYKLIEKIKQEQDIAIIMISHDLYMVMKSTDYIICLNKHICCQGCPKSITSNKGYKELFGEEVVETIAFYSHHHDHEHNHK